MTKYAELFKGEYSTSLMTDAAFRAGVEVGLPASGLRPLDLRSKLAGPAVTVEANNDLVSILEAVHIAEPSDVVVISNRTLDVALMGDLIGTEAVRKGLAGFVVDGFVRDTTELIEMGLPILCRGSYPAGPLKMAADLKGIGTIGGSISIAGARAASGMWVFGDADGLVILDAVDLGAVFELAAVAARQEQALADQIASGTVLADLFGLDSFLLKRHENPQADFNTHLAEIDQVI